MERSNRTVTTPFCHAMHRDPSEARKKLPIASFAGVGNIARAALFLAAARSYKCVHDGRNLVSVVPIRRDGNLKPPDA